MRLAPRQRLPRRRAGLSVPQADARRSARAPRRRRRDRRPAAAAFPDSDEAVLVERLRRDGDAVMEMVAADGVRVDGHVLLSRMKAPVPSVALAPLAVAADMRGRGIGGRLVTKAVDRARDAGWHPVFVLGKAAFYGRFGFDAEAARVFGSPYAEPHFMVRDLRGTLGRKGGPVRHAAAFGDLDRPKAAAPTCPRASQTDMVAATARFHAA